MAQPIMTAIGGFDIPLPQVEIEQRAAFDAIDKEKKGRINHHDLGEALSRGGYVFSHEVAKKIVNLYDPNHTGGLDFAGYLQAHAFITKMAASFRARDLNCDGKLQGDEVRAALVGAGYALTEAVFQLMMRKYDHERIGGLSFADYIDASIFLSSVRNVFAYYDRNQSGQVLFNFDAFMGAALSLQ